MRLRRCAATPHPPPSGAPSPQGEGLEGAALTPRTPQGEGLGLCGPGTRLPVTSSGGRLTPADGRGDEDRMEVGSENTWKKEWNFCR